jgi:hypothetical protein
MHDKNRRAPRDAHAQHPGVNTIFIMMCGSLLKKSDLPPSRKIGKEVHFYPTRAKAA